MHKINLKPGDYFTCSAGNGIVLGGGKVMLVSGFDAVGYKMQRASMPDDAEPFGGSSFYIALILASARVAIGAIEEIYLGPSPNGL